MFFKRLFGDAPTDPKDGITFQGKWWMELYDSNGKFKQGQASTNVVVTVGKDYLAQFLNSAAAAASTFTMKYIAIGTNGTAETAADTALGTEVSRTTGTVSYIATQIYQVKATFAAGSGTGAILEYGLFSSSSGGTMFCRNTDTVVNKGASDTLTVTAQITLS